MDNVVSTFPLLRLPKRAIMNTIRIMTLLQIFGVSVLSKKTKNLVESLKLTTKSFEIYITHSFKIQLIFPNFESLTLEVYQIWENEPLQELGTPGNIHSYCGIDKVKWANLLSVKQLLDQLRFIFHSSEVSLYFASDVEQFSLDSIHRNVKKIESIHIHSRNREYNGRILKVFQPAAFNIMESALIDERIPSHTLIQNLDTIRARNVHISKRIVND